MNQYNHGYQTDQVTRRKRPRSGDDVTGASEFPSDVLAVGEPEELHERGRRRPKSASTVLPPTCPMCRGTGWLRQPRNLPPWSPEYKSRVECSCLIEKRRLQRRQEMLALCTRFGFQREKTLSTFQAQVKGVLQAARQTKRMIGLLTAWAREREEQVRLEERSKVPPPAEWLVFIGPVGVGKTHLAMAIGNAALDANIVTLFATAPDLLDHLRLSFQPSSTVIYDELFVKLKEAELLLLDDLGAEQSSGWADEKLFQLLNYRYNLRLPTVVTLNKQAWDCLDVRLRSRLSDRSLVEIVNLEARDFRERQGKTRSESLPGKTTCDMRGGELNS